MFEYASRRRDSGPCWLWAMAMGEVVGVGSIFHKPEFRKRPLLLFRHGSAYTINSIFAKDFLSFFIFHATLSNGHKTKKKRKTTIDHTIITVMYIVRVYQVHRITNIYPYKLAKTYR